MIHKEDQAKFWWWTILSVRPQELVLRILNSRYLELRCEYRKIFQNEYSVACQKSSIVAHEGAALTAGPVLLVGGRLFNVIYEDDLYGPLGRFEFQPELLSCERKDRRAVDGSESATPFGASTHPVDIKFTGQPGFANDRYVQLRSG